METPVPTESKPHATKLRRCPGELMRVGIGASVGWWVWNVGLTIVYHGCGDMVD